MKCERLKWPDVVAIVSSCIVLFVEAFQWNIIDWVTPFLFAPIELFAYALLAISLLISVGSTILGNKKKISTYRPLCINSIALVMALFFPFTPIWLKVNFLYYKSARETIIKKVNSGELYSNIPDRPSIIALGNDYPNVSVGGNEILVEEHEGNKYIFFFSFRGILDHYSGFLYVPNDGDPQLFSDLNEESNTQIISYGHNWYFAAHR